LFIEFILLAPASPYSRAVGPHRDRKRHHPDAIAALRDNDGEQATSIGFAVVHEATFTLNVLFMNRNRIVEERLFRLLSLNPVRPNLPEVVPVPLEHRLLDCICNAYSPAQYQPASGHQDTAWASTRRRTCWKTAKEEGRLASVPKSCTTSLRVNYDPRRKATQVEKPKESLPDASHLYEVERRARHAERPGFWITELQISPTQTVPWHCHNNIQDTFYVLEGRLRLFLREPKEEVRLGPGETYSVRPRRPHLVTNGGDGSATFLVLQGIGEYDYVPLV
jgi:quercetin dioxygenase-like cupin family protein